MVNPDRQKVIDTFSSAAALEGDAGRGAAVFAKACATCHQFAGVGHAVGPDLASVGDKSPEGLLVSILDPNRDWSREIPLGRPNEPDDIAQSVLFLCSEASRNMTGAHLTVAGGLNPMG